MIETPSTDPRVYFAAERTLLAWLRTGLGMMGFGFVVARLGMFLREFGHTASAGSVHASFWIGTSLVFLSAVVYLIAVTQHVRLMARLARGEVYVPPKWSLGVILAIILAALGIGLAVYLTQLNPV